MLWKCLKASFNRRLNPRVSIRRNLTAPEDDRSSTARWATSGYGQWSPVTAHFRHAIGGDCIMQDSGCQTPTAWVIDELDPLELQRVALQPTAHAIASRQAFVGIGERNHAAHFVAHLLQAPVVVKHRHANGGDASPTTGNVDTVLHVLDRVLACPISTP